MTLWLTTPRADDSVVGWPEIELLVRDAYGGYVPIRVVIDTGADVATIPILMARRFGIGFSRTSVGRASGIVGEVTKWRDTIRIRIGRGQYEWPCDFTESPQTTSLAPRCVLGRAGLLDVFDFCMDDECFTLTRRSRLRRLWRSLWRWLFPPASLPDR